MTVGTFIQPDHETQFATPYKDAIDNSIQVLSRIGALFAPHEQGTPNMTVRLDAGALSGSTGPLEVAAQSTSTIAAPASQPRIDRVVIDASTGVVSVIQGTEAGSPVPPNVPSGKLPICKVTLDPSTTAITNANLTDERLLGGGSGVNQDILVGDLYFTTINYANGAAVAAAKAYGTWIRWGEGRFPVCFNAADSDFNTGEKTGGAKSKPTPTHAHYVQPHYHYSYTHTDEPPGYRNLGTWEYNFSYTDVSGASGGGNTDVGGSESMNVLNPYIVMFAWKRTA